MPCLVLHRSTVAEAMIVADPPQQRLTILFPPTGSCNSVLVSAGIELIFFLVAGTVLCFGCSVRVTLITV